MIAGRRYRRISGRFRQDPMGIEDEVHWRTLIEIGVAFWCVFKRYNLSIDDVRNRNAIM